MMFDTDHLSYFLSGRTAVRARMLAELERSGVYNISIITHYEILKGLAYKDAGAQLRKYDEMHSILNILPLNEPVARQAANIYSKLRRTGLFLEDNDILIAATSITNGLTLVTNNLRHFRRIPGLLLQNWSAE